MRRIISPFWRTAYAPQHVRHISAAINLIFSFVAMAG
jgi:hypothetical protein